MTTPTTGPSGTNPRFWIVLGLIALIIIVPLLYMLLTSLKTVEESRSVPPTLLPAQRIIIATLFLPAFIFMMPNFEILNRLGLTGYVAGRHPARGSRGLRRLLMRQFFSNFPVALEESARIDGAGPWKVFTAMLPNSRAAIVTLAVLSFLATGPTSSFPSTCCSHPSGSPFRSDWANCKGRTPSTIP